MKTGLFQSCDHCWVFQICWHNECNTLIATSFSIWNSSAETSAPPLALFTVMLPKSMWLCTRGCLPLGECSYHRGYLASKLPCPSLSPIICSDSCLLSQQCHPTISSSIVPFSFAFNLSQHQDLFQWGSCLHQEAKVLELQFQHLSSQCILSIDFL